MIGTEYLSNMVGFCTCACFCVNFRYFADLFIGVSYFCEQIRRQARLRREYLYRKSTEEQERTTYERKKKLRVALEGELIFSPRKQRSTCEAVH